MRIYVQSETVKESPLDSKSCYVKSNSTFNCLITYCENAKRAKIPMLYERYKSLFNTNKGNGSKELKNIEKYTNANEKKTKTCRVSVWDKESEGGTYTNRKSTTTKFIFMKIICYKFCRFTVAQFARSYIQYLYAVKFTGC